MDNNIILGIVGVVALIFLVSFIFSVKTWRIPHLFFVFLLLCANVAFVFFAAASLKTETAWRKKYEEEKAATEKLAAETEMLEVGWTMKNGVVVENKDELSIKKLEQLIEYQNYGRELVWSGCRPTNITLSTAADGICD